MTELDEPRRAERIALDSVAEEKALEAARDALLSGELVAFPTDTVYGLGAAAGVPGAQDRLARAKGRSPGRPFAYLVPDVEGARGLVHGWTRAARKLARAFWPGPLTIVVGGVGLRLPDHRFARRLAAVPGGLLATSANRSGERDPRTADDVLSALGGRCALVVDGGACPGVPSAVVRVDRSGIEVLRAGSLGGDEILWVSRPRALILCEGNSCRSPMAEALLRRELAALGAGEVEVLSAALGEPESRASEEAARACREIGLDISAHRPRPATARLLGASDWIYAVEKGHGDRVESLLGEDVPRVEPLDPTGVDVKDPAGLGREAYVALRDRLAGLVSVRAGEIARELQAPERSGGPRRAEGL